MIIQITHFALVWKQSYAVVTPLRKVATYEPRIKEKLMK